MRVEVTEWHIEQGLAGDRGLCPIALALRTATGDVWYVDRRTAVSADELSDQDEFLLPEPVRNFVRDFDDVDEAVYLGPFSFEAPVVDHARDDTRNDRDRW